jgi:hypothetical protein
MPGREPYCYQKVKIQKGRVECNQILMNGTESDFKIIPGGLKYSSKFSPGFCFDQGHTADIINIFVCIGP